MAARLTMESGLLAEFETPEALLTALRGLRGQGYTRVDTFTPFPVPGVEELLGLPRSNVMRVALLAALCGGGGAYFFQWWISAVSYPFNVGGRPPHSGLAFVPITFEMCVLFAAVTSFLSVFVMSGLPRLWHPVFEVDGFERASIDRFFLGVEARDPKFDRAGTAAELTAGGALRVVELGEAAVKTLLLVVLALAACDRGELDWSRMKHQEKGKPYRDTPYLAGGQVLLEPPAGTVTVERDLSAEAQPPVTAALLQTGRERFEVFCAACHGVLGDAQTEVARHMLLRPPPSLHEDRIRAYDVREIHDVIVRGDGLMPSYAEQIAPRDRWAVAQYVKALQWSQHAPAAQLAAEDRAALERAP